MTFPAAFLRGPAPRHLRNPPRQRPATRSIRLLANMTCVTCDTGNRHTTRHHQRKTRALESARQNRYTDRLHTASAERSHTFGTRLINRDVPQEVVRVLLDHSSGEMTAHYARLHDATVRRAWEKARKINVKGEDVTIDPGGPLAEANWAKQRLGRATQALSNGYCGLPV